MHFKYPKYIFKSKVVINNPEYNVKSEELEYFTESNYTYFNDKTLITGIDYSILCKNGFYDTVNQKGYFRDDAIINYDGKIINGDSIFFENEKLIWCNKKPLYISAVVTRRLSPVSVEASMYII